MMTAMLSSIPGSMEVRKHQPEDKTILSFLVHSTAAILGSWIFLLCIKTGVLLFIQLKKSLG